MTDTFIQRPTPPDVGDTVRALQVPGYESCAGSEVVVTLVDRPHGNDTYVVHAEFQDTAKPDDTINLGFIFWEPVEGLSEAASKMIQAERDALKARVERLETDLNTAQRQLEFAGRMRMTVSEEFWREAERREWCSEADDFVERVNNLIPAGWELEERDRAYTVTRNTQMLVEVAVTTTITARTEDDAINLAKERGLGVGTDDIIRAVRNGDWQTDDEYDEEWIADTV